MTDTPKPPHTTQNPEPENRTPYLSDDPASLTDYLKKRESSIAAQDTADHPDTPPPSYCFADFVSEMNKTDFDDVYQIRAILESQAHLLGTAFHYLMMRGDWKNLATTLRTQKAMRDTIEAMNVYPSLYYCPEFKKDAPNLDT